MKNYKATMARIDKIISERDKKIPVSTSGLLAPKQREVTQKKTGVEETLANYIAIIRKQREELIK